MLRHLYHRDGLRNIGLPSDGETSGYREIDPGLQKLLQYADSLQALLRDQSDMPDELAGLPMQTLKHGTGRFAHILLVPQPSDSPNDPLNWYESVPRQ